MVSVLPYERAARASPKNKPRLIGAYLKDYDTAQKFGFFRMAMKKLFDSRWVLWH
jgi:hypothetical protein